MKKLLLLVLTPLLLISCSNDDTPETIANTGLVKFQQVFYEDGDIRVKQEIHYNNGIPNKAYQYTALDQLVNYTVYNYNPNGLVASVILYSPDNTELVKVEYNYDDENRMIKRTYREGSYSFETEYTHNTFQNTITSTTVTNEGSTTSKTFYLHTNGLIYKEIIEGSNSYYKINFSGSNPVSAETNWGGVIKTFTYDEAHDLSLMGRVNIFGSYKPNLVLASNSLEQEETSVATKYLIQKDDSEIGITNINYSFTENGRPKFRSTYVNGTLTNQAEYIYVD